MVPGGARSSAAPRGLGALANYELPLSRGRQGGKTRDVHAQNPTATTTIGLLWGIDGHVPAPRVRLHLTSAESM